jgi:hypothetical protein
MQVAAIAGRYPVLAFVTIFLFYAFRIGDSIRGASTDTTPDKSDYRTLRPLVRFPRLSGTRG